MNFDIKDIKSWSNRHDVHIGDKGYLFNLIDSFRDGKDVKVSTIDRIYDDSAFCFSALDYCETCGFFLPLNAVKEDRLKEKKYRPFKDLYEFYIFLSHSAISKEKFNQNLLLGEFFTYRDKNAPRFPHTIVINRIDFDLADDPCEPCIECRNLGLWFDYAEIMNDDGKWQPFGVEKND